MKIQNTDRSQYANFNVILIGIDTLRADHLGCYGYFRKTSPNIDTWAQQGILFKNAFSQSSKTTPSFMSMLTSLYPPDHGVLAVLNSDAPDRPIVKINDAIKTLPQILKEHGYKTHSMVTSNQLPKEFGFGNGFDTFEEGHFYAKREDFLTWLGKNRDEKFFIFYHDNGLHDPYMPKKPYDRLYDPHYRGDIPHNLREPDYSTAASDNPMETKLKQVKLWMVTSDYFWSKVNKDDPRDIEHVKALYDGAIKELDDFIGRLQEVLTKQNLWKNTIIIFTSDHGEEFFEHGQFMHDQLYDEILHVPLIISGPNMKRKIEVNQETRTIDIMPTLLDMLAIPYAQPSRGESLFPLIKNPVKPRSVCTVSTMQGRTRLTKAIRLSLNGARYKYIDKPLNNKQPQELYNLTFDPGEKTNLIASESDKAAKLANELEKTLGEKKYIFPPTPIKLELDEWAKENLRSLGY